MSRMLGLSAVDPQEATSKRNTVYQSVSASGPIAEGPLPLNVFAGSTRITVQLPLFSSYLHVAKTMALPFSPRDQ